MKYLYLIIVVIMFGCSNGSPSNPVGSGEIVDYTSDAERTELSEIEIIDFQYILNGMYITMTGASFKNTGEVDLDNLSITFNVTIYLDPYMERVMFTPINNISLKPGEVYNTSPASHWVDIFDYNTHGTHHITMEIKDRTNSVFDSFQKTFIR